MVAADVDVDVDAIGDAHRVGHGLGVRAEEAGHLVGALDVEIVGVELHPLLVAEGLAGADAEEDFVGEGVGLVEVMGVVRADELQSDFTPELRHERHDLLLIGNAVVLDLEEEVLRAEDLFVRQRGVFGFLIVAAGQRLRDLPFEA